MNLVQKEMRKNTLIQILAGFVLWFVFQPKIKKTAVIIPGLLEPVGVDYISEFFKDSEYFGKSVIPVDFYGNWLTLAMQLDKIRTGFGLPITIKKGFNISEPKFANCSAVEIYPQNNNVERLKEVIDFMKSDLNLQVIEYKENKNIYLEI